jgi:hypothetical protein
MCPCRTRDKKGRHRNTNLATCGKFLVILVRFQVFTASGMKVTVFWDVVPCSLLELHQCVRGAYYFHREGDETNFPDDAGRQHLKQQ